MNLKVKTFIENLLNGFFQESRENIC